MRRRGSVAFLSRLFDWRDALTVVSPATLIRWHRVFVVIEHASRRLIDYDVTAHPSAAWTLQQLREVVGFGDRYRLSLSPGIPESPAITKFLPQSSSRHRRGESCAILGRLHHEYSLTRASA